MLTEDRTRLCRLLRMFSSDFDGEVAAAARRAHELLQRLGTDWDDVLVMPRRNSKAKLDPETREVLRRLGELSLCLSAWEREFIASLAVSQTRWGHLTPKQAACLDRIVERLQAAGLWEESP